MVAPSESTSSYDTPEGYRFGYWVKKNNAGTTIRKYFQFHWKSRGKLSSIFEAELFDPVLSSGWTSSLSPHLNCEVQGLLPAISF
jgi:hypothetical protein